MLNTLRQALYTIADRAVLSSITDHVGADRRQRDWAELNTKSDEALKHMGLSPDLVRKGP